MITRTGILFVAVTLAAVCIARSESTVPPQEASPLIASLSAAEIFHRLDQANDVRSAKLKSYTSIRRYSVFEPKHPPDAALSVSMQFVAPSTKNFKTISHDGVGFIHTLVFDELIKAEQQTSTGKSQAATAISSNNYDARLAGEESIRGRPAYILELKPKREDKFLMLGRIWVDKEDFAVARLEGDPMKNLSWWVTRSHLTREYQKIGNFWLQQRDETDCLIRFVGPYFLRIEYSDYKLDAGS